jgi:hypothetical protein
MKPMRPSIFVLGLFAAAGCGPAEEQPAEDPLFIAHAKDFQAFPTWERFHLEGDGSGTPHTGVERDIYLNNRPPKGSKEFPVGTIIVKRTDGVGDVDGPRTFAMVKRGKDYNKAGALNWEWFELLQSDSSDASSPWQLSWRGLGPTTGGGYSTGGTSECNGCHAQAQPNDYVQAGPLQLSTLAR